MNVLEKEQSGLNTDLGSQCSRIAYSYAKKTFSNRTNLVGNLIQTVDGGYSSQLDVLGARIGISSDGIGTKVEIAERVQKYNTLGFDLIAMTIDDLICNGFEPAFLSNILDVDKLDDKIVDSLMNGLQQAADYSNIVITGGEIAELGSRIGGYGDRMHFNWCATGIGVLHTSLAAPITGQNIAEGDSIITLYNPGFRSNGFSLVRKILFRKYGENWHEKKTDGLSAAWGETALTPCLIYSPVITKLLESGVALNGIAHITGGGVVDNLGRLLKVNKFGADLHSLFEPEDYYNELISLGDVSLHKAYQYWNMNNGMMIVLNESEAVKALAILSKETRYKAQAAGIVTKEQVIRIDLGKMDSTPRNSRELEYKSYHNK